MISTLGLRSSLDLLLWDRRQDRRTFSGGRLNWPADPPLCNGLANRNY